MNSAHHVAPVQQFSQITKCHHMQMLYHIANLFNFESSDANTVV